ncbi:MAG: response regulator transcription factor [Eggerthellaceae bacterium]|jgi:DNA-binding response OmpR family regulator|nr:response regulator transcription factor [Eggerthellaceae bacterium]
MRILLVEDDKAIVATLGDLLREEGYDVTCASTQDSALAALEADRFDLALLDVGLPQGNGFAVCAAARSSAPDMPVIFLTASDDEYSTVAGLDMGAVDYIAKPFRPRELLSRIRAALRARQGAASSVTLGDVTVDPATGTVRKGGAELFLSALEYRLLLFFAQHKGRLVTREMLRDAIWDTAGEYVSDNSLNVYIKRLREKVEADPAEPQLIVTVRGLGYRVEG